MSNVRPVTQISKNQTCKIVLNCPTGTVIELVDERDTALEGIECRVRADGAPALIRITNAKGQIEVQAEDIGNASGFEVDFPTLEPDHVSVGEKDQPVINGAHFRCTANQHYQFRYNTRTKVYMGLFFDGTGNNMYVDEPLRQMSNVACLFRAFDENEKLNHIAHYINGVGTQLTSTECTVTTPLDCLEALRDSVAVGGGFAAGMRNRLDFMLNEIQIEFDRFPALKELDFALFGFSRGAVAARIFCNWINEYTPKWQKQFPGLQVKIRFLGIFDSVSSIGIAGNNIDLGFNKDVPNNVESVVHFVAAHERRKFFPLQSIRASSTGNLPANWIEFAFPGVHSDVGGGYVLDQVHADSQGRYPRLAAIPLQHMHSHAINYGVPLLSIVDFLRKEQEKFTEYYDPSDQANKLYEKYSACITEQHDLRKLYDEHDRWYFYWLASTQSKMPEHFDAGSASSLNTLWNREYTMYKNGYIHTRDASGKMVRQPINTSQATRQRLAWIDEYFQAVESGKAKSKSTLHPLFETYVHDSVAAYRLVDGYLQSRNLFYLGESRWVKEENI